MNPTVQGGTYCSALGFPTGGRAHRRCELAPDLLISARGHKSLAHMPGIRPKYNRFAATIPRIN